ncbi:hypothetical protein E2C01_046226 [Portunus trituberculatus]|uniref:Uncharacterized protein n=1 Tax=Portunus trituberculatus TaxID=210409 RepID=A0A5B7G5C6_PORTR|nr:hypothetical protein [Portunus trituberculatus]
MPDMLSSVLPRWKEHWGALKARACSKLTSSAKSHSEWKRCLCKECTKRRASKRWREEEEEEKEEEEEEEEEEEKEEEKEQQQ